MKTLTNRAERLLARTQKENDPSFFFEAATSPSSSEELADEAEDLDLLVGPGRVEEERVAEQAKVRPDRLDQHRLLVREAAEGVLAVVRPHAALADAAKGQLAVTHVEERAVDGHAAGACVGAHQLLEGRGAREDVERQRLRPAVDKADCLFDVADGDERQDRAECLLNHQGRVDAALDDRRCNKARRFVVGAAADDTAAVRAQQAHETGHLLVADDAAKVAVGLWIVAVELLDVLGRELTKLLDDLLVAQHVVGRDALLAGVHHAAPHCALGSQVQVAVFVDKHRVLAAQLEDAGREVLCCALHNLLANDGAACKEDGVKAFLEQSSGALTIPLKLAADHRKDTGVHVLGKQCREQCCGGAGHNARLEDDRAAGGDGAKDGGEREQHGVVPRGNDQGHAAGFLLKPLRAREGEDVEADAGGLRPLPQVLDGVLNLADR
eukprot:m.125340 g.125340  ORF g.125340 m.125340 type:complete len:439 (+) comp16317_c0_seq2:150-1466(+)